MNTTEVTEPGSYYSAKQFKIAVGVTDHNTFKARLEEYGIKGIKRLNHRYVKYTQRHVDEFLKKEGARKASKGTGIYLPTEVKHEIATLRTFLMDERARSNKTLVDMEARLSNIMYREITSEFDKMSSKITGLEDRLTKFEAYFSDLTTLGTNQ